MKNLFRFGILVGLSALIIGCSPAAPTRDYHVFEAPDRLLQDLAQKQDLERAATQEASQPVVLLKSKSQEALWKDFIAVSPIPAAAYKAGMYVGIFYQPSKPDLNIILTDGYSGARYPVVDINHAFFQEPTTNIVVLCRDNLQVIDLFEVDMLEPGDMLFAWTVDKPVAGETPVSPNELAVPAFYYSEETGLAIAVLHFNGTAEQGPYPARVRTIKPYTVNIEGVDLTVTGFLTLRDTRRSVYYFLVVPSVGKSSCYIEGGSPDRITPDLLRACVP